MNVENRTLFIADNLDIMRGIDDETVDLIYLDPPFNTKKNYKAPIGSPAEGAEFKDIWTDEDIKFEWHGEIAETNEELYQIIRASETVYDRSMRIYLTAMAVRLFEMRRILKSTGSIYLHCDPTASHYLKLVMDSLFGKNNFRNEIVWCYKDIGGKNTKYFKKKHDIILSYSKSKSWKHNIQRGEISESTKKRFNKYFDSNGQITYASLKKTNPGVFKKLKGIPQDLNDVWLDIKKGTQLLDWWQDISPLKKGFKEQTGYPTQKPLKLLERIIKASSNAGDMVLDPFCGCATACVAAERLSRQWVGIDISPSAEDITKLRLSEEVDKGVDLWNPFQDVIVTSEPPVRTSAPTPTRQMHLPAAHTHKHALFGQQEGKCNGCLLMFPFRNMTIDHIVAQSLGGTDHIENLQLLCNACNSTKSTRSQEEFIEILIERGIRSAR